MSVQIQSTQDDEWLCATCEQPENKCWCETEQTNEVVE